MERGRLGIAGTALGAVLACAGPARALLNVDLHNPAVDPPDNDRTHEGSPSDAFGAAANQSGRWNVGDVSDITMTPQPLVDLQGMATPWTLTIDIDGTHNFDHFSTPAGDETALLDDGHRLPTVIGEEANFILSGLPADTYDVYTYGWHSFLADRHTITIEIGGVQLLVQPSTSNFMDTGFAEGETHTVHRSVVVGMGEDLVITAIATADDGPDDEFEWTVNGFQIVPAPEPGRAWLQLTAWLSVWGGWRASGGRCDV